MEALRATLVAALTTMSVMRIVVVLATGQFSLLALKMILLAAPAVLGTSWLLRRYPPLATRDGAQDRVRVASPPASASPPQPCWDVESARMRNLCMRDCACIDEAAH
jgi:hypothetical protein